MSAHGPAGSRLSSSMGRCVEILRPRDKGDGHRDDTARRAARRRARRHRVPVRRPRLGRQPHGHHQGDSEPDRRLPGRLPRRRGVPPGHLHGPDDLDPPGGHRRVGHPAHHRQHRRRRPANGGRVQRWPRRAAPRALLAGPGRGAGGPTRLPPTTSTRCYDEGASRAPTCWSATPSAACWRGSLPTSTPPTSRMSCWWTPRRSTGSRPCSGCSQLLSLAPLSHNPEGFDLRHGLSSLTPLDRPGVLDRRPLAVM